MNLHQMLDAITEGMKPTDRVKTKTSLLAVLSSLALMSVPQLVKEKDTQIPEHIKDYILQGLLRVTKDDVVMSNVIESGILNKEEIKALTEINEQEKELRQITRFNIEGMLGIQ